MRTKQKRAEPKALPPSYVRWLRRSGRSPASILRASATESTTKSLRLKSPGEDGHPSKNLQPFRGVPAMVDPLRDRYQDPLDGSYDCVDRIVVNAYFSLGHNPGGFRIWWRRLLGSEDHLDNTHLKRLAGRFSRRLYAFAKKRHLPVVRGAPGERKHEIAEEYLTTHAVSPGLFLITVSRAPALVWKIHPESCVILSSSSRMLMPKAAKTGHNDSANDVGVVCPLILIKSALLGRGNCAPFGESVAPSSGSQTRSSLLHR